VNKLVKVGRTKVAAVLRVNEKDAAMCHERYARSKTVHSIVRRVAHLAGVGLEQLYEAVVWPLYHTHGHAFKAFETMSNDDGAEAFARLEEHHGKPVSAFATPEIRGHLLREIVFFSDHEVVLVPEIDDVGVNRQMLRLAERPNDVGDRSDGLSFSLRIRNARPGLQPVHMYRVEQG